MGGNTSMRFDAACAVAAVLEAAESLIGGSKTLPLLSIATAAPAESDVFRAQQLASIRALRSFASVSCKSRADIFATLFSSLY